MHSSHPPSVLECIAGLRLLLLVVTVGTFKAGQVVTVEVQGQSSCDRGRSRDGLDSGGLVAVDVHLTRPSRTVDVHSTSRLDVRGRGVGRDVAHAPTSPVYVHPPRA